MGKAYEKQFTEDYNVKLPPGPSCARQCAKCCVLFLRDLIKSSHQNSEVGSLKYARFQMKTLGFREVQRLVKLNISALCVLYCLICHQRNSNKARHQTGRDEKDCLPEFSFYCYFFFLS